MNIAVVLSGGSGSRAGTDIPKQYIEVNEKPVIAYAVEQLSINEKIDGIQIVAEKAWQRRISDYLKLYDTNRKFRGYSVPGMNRQLSIFHALEDIRKYAENEDVVLVHDAARPFLSQKLISDCIGAIDGHDGVIPVLSVKDTVYSSENGRYITGLLSRSEIFAGQAPEAFRLGLYYEANRRLLPEGILKVNGSTEPAVMAGMNIVMIPGDERNFKITTREDLEHFQAVVEHLVT